MVGGYFRDTIWVFVVPFYPINTARVVFSSDLKIDPLNLYPNKINNLDLYSGQIINKVDRRQIIHRVAVDSREYVHIISIFNRRSVNSRNIINRESEASRQRIDRVICRQYTDNH